MSQPPPRPQPAITAEELSKRFGDHLAVDRLSFTVASGTLLGVLGENGAGKSTLLHLLGGQLLPTRGRVLVLGIDVAREPRKVRRRLSTMQQTPHFQDDLTLLEHLRLFCGAWGLPRSKAQKRFAELCDSLDLAGDLTQQARSWPSGTRKRAALLFALVPQPEVLLLDEPTSGVDLYDQMLFWDLFQDLSARGTTICVTTHRPEEAEHCHQVAVLDRGRLFDLASPLQLKVRHLSGWPMRLDLPPGLPHAPEQVQRHLEASGYLVRPAGPSALLLILGEQEVQTMRRLGEVLHGLGLRADRLISDLPPLAEVFAGRVGNPPIP